MKLLHKPGTEWYKFVYLLESNGVYKIGYSRFPLGRLRKLQTGSPYPIQIVYKIKTQHYRRLESMLHCHFSEKRLHNEWFALDAEDVDYFKSLNAIGRTPEEEAAAVVEHETYLKSDAYAESLGRMRRMLDRLNERASIYSQGEQE